MKRVSEPILPFKLKHLQALDAKVQQRIEVRQQQAAAERREWAWAKASALLREELDARRKAAREATAAEVHDLLRGVK
jgi:hypothetical protein